MDKAIKKGFEDVERLAKRKSSKLVKMDVKRDKKCGMSEKKAKNKN